MGLCPYRIRTWFSVLSLFEILRMSQSTWLSDFLCSVCKNGTRFFGRKRFSSLDDADQYPSQFSKQFKYRLLFLHFLDLNIVFMHLSKDGISPHEGDRSQIHIF